MVGVMELSGRWPGAMALASDLESAPKQSVRDAGCVVKSSISVVEKKPGGEKWRASRNCR